jgi:ribokinase
MVLVVGSANMDLVVRSVRFPKPGETILGSSFETFPGGKGANQAAAAGLLGDQARFIGKVGGDAFGEELRQSLADAGVDTTHMLRDDGPSGVAAILVDASAQNMIVVAPGANAKLSAQEVEAAIDAAPEARVLLVQLETPMETVLAAFRRFRESRQGIAILNPAPAAALPNALYELIDVITPNETEAAALTGLEPVDDASCRACAQALLDRGVGSVVITLGSHGCYWNDGRDELRLDAYHVEAVDTTAAGDAFNGALAVALSEGLPMRAALEFASAAGALAVTKAGAQAAMPSREEVEALLRR